MDDPADWTPDIGWVEEVAGAEGTTGTSGTGGRVGTVTRGVGGTGGRGVAEVETGWVGGAVGVEEGTGRIGVLPFFFLYSTSWHDLPSAGFACSSKPTQ